MLQTCLNRLLAFHEQSGVLECEAGASFAEIITHFLPRGWFLPTTPGTKHVTVGGAIAADVHGKNHHIDGSLCKYVLELTLLTAAGDLIICSPTRNSRVFEATVGGMGLTGVIVSARIQLLKTSTAYLNVDFKRTANLDETLQSCDEYDSSYKYSVAWVDCLASKKSLGRAILMFANHATLAELPGHLSDRPLQIQKRREVPVPCFFPAFVLNRWTAKTFNALYYAKHPTARLQVDYDTFFYPQDRLMHWNRVYGRRGFLEYQALFPVENARAGLIELLQVIVNENKAPSFAVLKRSGPASRGMLSFLYPGYTLAMHFQNSGESVLRLFRRLDDVLLKYGGRLYLAKDAAMSPEVFSAMYPRLGEFRKVKATLDPENRFLSSQAKRLKIFEEQWTRGS